MDKGENIDKLVDRVLSARSKAGTHRTRGRRIRCMMRLSPTTLIIMAIAIGGAVLLGFVWNNYTITVERDIPVIGGTGEAVAVYFDDNLLTGTSLNLTLMDVTQLNAGDTVRGTHMIRNENGHGYNFTLTLDCPAHETNPEALWYGLWIECVEESTTTPLYEFRVAPETNYSFDIVYTVDPLFADPGVDFPFKLVVDIELYDVTPVGVNDFYQTQTTTPLIVTAPGVLGNDILPQGAGTLTAVLMTDVTHGTLEFNSDGSFNYTADSGFSGDDTFIYKPYVGEVGGYNATVTITVTAPLPCEAVDDGGYMTRGTTKSFNVLANDLDHVGSGLQITSAVIVAGPANSVTIVGTFPSQQLNVNAKNVGGTITIDYVIQDGLSNTDTGRLVVTVL